MSDVLSKSFFDRDTKTVAKELLGQQLVRDDGKTKETFIITETEAYLGEHDKACHAHKGRTERTEVMYGPAGYFYVYLVYGMYHMLNIITEEEGHPAGVLIRGAGVHDGPGKLTQYLDVDKTFDTKRVDPETGLWVRQGDITVDNADITTTPRIGVGYAGEWAKKPLRFILKEKHGSGT